MQVDLIQQTQFIAQSSTYPTTQESGFRLDSTTSSSSAGWRRMRTETSSTSSFEGELVREAEQLHSQFLQAFMQQHYAEALIHLSNAEVKCENLVNRIEFVLESLTQSTFKGTRAYVLGMMKDPQAIALCNTAAEQLKQGMLEALKLAQEFGYENKTEEFNTTFDAAHQFYRGFLHLSIGQQEETIRDLKASLLVLGLDKDWENVPVAADAQSLAFLKILEQKLGQTLLPIPQSVDSSDAMNLFIAGRYNEVLALISSDSSDFDTFDLKVASLALSGRIDEARALISSDSEDEPMSLLLDFLEGDYAKIKATPLTTDYSPILWMVRLAANGL